MPTMTLFRHKLSAILAGAALSLASSATAQTTTHEAAPAPARATAAASSGPALWKVADEDTTIYLFGTVHALPKDVEWYGGPIAQALTASQTLVTEIGGAELKSPATQQKFAARASLPQGQSLRTMLTPEQLATYEGALAKLKLPPATFDQYKPWFAALILTTIPMLNAGYSPEAGVESAIEAKLGSSVNRVALETVDMQLDLFDGLPIPAQKEYLLSVAEDTDSVVPSLAAMVSAWAKGDADGLAELMNAELEDPVLADRLLYARNRAWAEWIHRRLDQPGTVFIAVGAGHLAGTNSVQDYLTKSGTEVVRVQ